MEVLIAQLLIIVRRMWKYRWVGLVVAALLLLSVPLFGFPLVGLVLWVVPASICLMRERAQGPAA